jgi:hypothetical protein
MKHTRIKGNPITEAALNAPTPART